MPAAALGTASQVWRGQKQPSQTQTLCPGPGKDTHQLDMSAGEESALPGRVASSISQTGCAGQGSPLGFHRNTDSAPHLPSALHPPG